MSEKTPENLRRALMGEAGASIRYLGFARKADEEGCSGAARLFRAAAAAEMVHAQSHQRVLNSEEGIIADLKSERKTNEEIEKLEAEGRIRTTPENLKAAVEGETHEFKTMYPAMIRDAAAEKRMDARHSLEYAMSIEMIHAKLFKKALADPGKVDVSVYFVCPVCGHTVEEKAPSKCPYCGVDASEFTRTH